MQIYTEHKTNKQKSGKVHSSIRKYYSMISKDIKLGGALCQCNIHVNMISNLSPAYSVTLSG